MRFRRIIIIVTLLIISWINLPALADISEISPGGTVFIGEEGLDISASGLNPGDKIVWWAPGSSQNNVPAATVTIYDPKHVYISSSDFSGKEGLWYKLPGNMPVFNVKQPSMKIGVYDETQDFEGTGKWIPKGDIVSFRIESNIFMMFGRPGVTGAPIDITISSPEGGQYSSVNGPSGYFSLSGVPVTSGYFSTGPVWATGGLNAGTYNIKAECTANNLNENNPDPGTGVSPSIEVLIQNVNPLINSSKGEDQEGKSLLSGQKASENPATIKTASQTPIKTITPEVIQTAQTAQTRPIETQVIQTPQNLQTTTPKLKIVERTTEPLTPFPTKAQVTPVSVIAIGIGISLGFGLRQRGTR